MESNLDFEGNEIDLEEEGHKEANLSINKSPIIVKTKTIVKNSQVNSSNDQATDLSVMEGRKIQETSMTENSTIAIAGAAYVAPSSDMHSSPVKRPSKTAGSNRRYPYKTNQIQMDIVEFPLDLYSKNNFVGGDQRL